MHKAKILFLLVLFFCSACNPGEITLPSWSTEFLLPLVKDSFSFNDLQTDSIRTSLEADENQFLTFVYRASRDKIRVGEKLKLKDQRFETDIPIFSGFFGDFEFEVAISASDLGIEPAENQAIPPFNIDLTQVELITSLFENATVESGTLSFSLENQFPFDILPGMLISLVNKQSNTIFFSHQINQAIPAGSSYVLSPPSALNNQYLEGDIYVRLENMQSNGASNATITAQTGLEFTMQFNQLRLQRALLVLPELIGAESVRTFEIEMPYGAELNRFTIGSGNLVLQFGQVPDYPLIIRAEILNSNRNGLPLRGDFTLVNNLKAELDLADLFVDLSLEQASVYNQLSLSLEILTQGSKQPVEVDFGVDLPLSVVFEQIRPQSVFGYLGTFEEITQDTFKIDVFNLIKGGNLAIKSPEIRLRAVNDLGAAASLSENREQLYFIGKNERLYPNQSVRMNGINQLNIPEAPFLGDVSETLYVISPENDPDFSSLVSLLPSDLFYSIPYKIGTDFINHNQFASDTAGIKTFFEFVLPLEFAAQDLLLQESFKYKLEAKSPTTQITGATLNFKLDNYFPFELGLQAYFIDSLGQVLDSAFSEDKILLPASANQEGVIIEPIVQEFVAELSDQKLQNMINAVKIMPSVRLNTRNQQDVRIYSFYRLDLLITGLIQVEINKP